MPLGPSDLIISDGCALPLRLPLLPPHSLPSWSFPIFAHLQQSNRIPSSFRPSPFPDLIPLYSLQCLGPIDQGRLILPFLFPSSILPCVARTPHGCGSRSELLVQKIPYSLLTKKGCFLGHTYYCSTSNLSAPRVPHCLFGLRTFSPSFTTDLGN